MTASSEYRFPFGRPVTPCRPSATGQRDIFVLGAYPSALHVAWTPAVQMKRAEPYERIRAIAVDNEPEPFWCGGVDEENKRIETWKAAVVWKNAWGTLAAVKNLNGSSGVWVRDHVLSPLKISRAEAHITDCLNIYHCSKGLAVRLSDTYREFALEVELPAAQLPAHPSEGQIVEKARAIHLQRLRQELANAKPKVIVTLGNAALRVLSEIVECTNAPRKLAIKAYGNRLAVHCNGYNCEWLPLSHPAAPKIYQEAHSRWADS